MDQRERRRSKRVHVPRDVKGGVVIIEQLEVIDLSHGGIRFTCNKRLNPSQLVHLMLRKDTARLNLRGKVLRSMFVGAVRVQGGANPSYEVVVAFEHASQGDQAVKDFVRLIEALTG